MPSVSRLRVSISGSSVLPSINNMPVDRSSEQCSRDLVKVRVFKQSRDRRFGHDPDQHRPGHHRGKQLPQAVDDRRSTQPKPPATITAPVDVRAEGGIGGDRRDARKRARQYPRQPDAEGPRSPRIRDERMVEAKCRKLPEGGVDGRDDRGHADLPKRSSLALASRRPPRRLVSDITVSSPRTTEACRTGRPAVEARQRAHFPGILSSMPLT